MSSPMSISLPSLTTRDMWRWVLIAMGAAFIAHGLFSKNMRIRDSRTWEGTWRGKIVSNPRQRVYMRSLFTLIGVSMVFCGLIPTVP
jgi:hypothetical protein